MKKIVAVILLSTLWDWKLGYGQSVESSIQVADGFEVTQVYAVPRESQGSWVALCVDPKGRLIAGDQNGGLFRITLDNGMAKSVEPLDIEIGFVNGLTFAFDSLYAVVAEDEFEGGGLYRIRDLDGDDQFDEVEYLRDFVAKGEHGPHSVIPGPNGKWLYVISGNKTPLPEGPGFKSLVPPHWGEDDLLPRIWGPIGSEKGTTAPGGWIARTDPEGETWELVSIGFRNAFDIAFNEAGDLFTTDADAEFDMDTAWYQPTRLLHIVTGTDYGWRSGSGKWPSYFADTIAPVYEYGPGSPTGITFGYNTHFPEHYQQALFASDWSWGRVFVSWLKEEGGSYTSVTEEFLTGVPLPIADIVVNPMDGALYFVLGGRGTTSGLYRVSHVGETSDDEVPSMSLASAKLQEDRQMLELLINSAADEEVPIAWPYLSSEDRVLRHTARLVLEHVPPEVWKDEAFEEPHPLARMTALLGLARAGESKDLSSLLSSLREIDFEELSREEKIIYLRTLEVAFISMDRPEDRSQAAQEKVQVKRLLETQFPAHNTELDAELIKLLVYLKSSNATPVAIELLESAVTQEDKLRFLLPLRLHTEGWNRPLRERLFTALGQAHGWTGGLSLTKYVEVMVVDFLSTIPDEEKQHYKNILEEARPRSADLQASNRQFVKVWSLNDLMPISESDLVDRDLVNGRQAFTAASCFACHRVKGVGGGIGPDLSAALRRFSVHDFLEAIIEPSKVISDQFGMSLIQKTDGTQIHGKVVNYYGDSIGIQVDPLNGAKVQRVPRSEIDLLKASPVSPMPPGLINVLSREDILDMMAFLKAPTDL